MDNVPDLRPAQYLKSFHVSPKFGLVYVNNPKVACSTIKLTLQRAELGDPAYEPKTTMHDHRNSPMLTFPDLTQERIEAALADSFVFSFVRNPFTRLRSAYLNKIVTGQKNGKPRMDAGFGRDECPSFDAFVAAVTAQDPSEHNSHWRPQAMTLSLAHVTFDFIGKMEEFSAGWARVVAATGLPDVVYRSGKPNDYAAHDPLLYTPQTAQMVRKAYAMDFEAFGYAPEAV